MAKNFSSYSILNQTSLQKPPSSLTPPMILPLKPASNSTHSSTPLQHPSLKYKTNDEIVTYDINKHQNGKPV